MVDVIAPPLSGTGSRSTHYVSDFDGSTPEAFVRI